jgi:hypothetical protein
MLSPRKPFCGCRAAPPPRSLPALRGGLVGHNRDLRVTLPGVSIARRIPRPCRPALPTISSIASKQSYPETSLHFRLSRTAFPMMVRSRLNLTEKQINKLEELVRFLPFAEQRDELERMSGDLRMTANILKQWHDSSS